MIPNAQTRVLEPFGLEVRVPEGTDWSTLPVESVHEWVAKHRVVVIRGLRTLDKVELPGAARRLGPLQAWDFGAVNELKPDAAAKNYLFTRHAVPLHWDGAFAGRVPRYLFFRCLAAPDPEAGGETCFVDTTRVWERADDATRDRWRALRFVYETERLAHYGGRFSARAVSQHPYTGETVLRFAEPVDDLNPVSVRAEGLGPLESAATITELRRALYQSPAVLHHRWQEGDVVIADNHALLHGRRPFEREAKRHIQRVNVHGPERTWKDALRDSLRIRRPEFMVAELPILLIPALLLTPSVAQLATGTFAATVALFMLLFHFGDMVNCLADRDLDAVYKTHLSEAVYGLGPAHVRRQIAVTALLALGLAVGLAHVTGRWELLLLVGFGLGLGALYSVQPLRLKGRGPWQVVTLWAVIFVGPMLLVARALSASLPPVLLGLILAYGAMQEGIILVNTAEDLPEDEAAGIRTTAVALGLSGCLALATAMVALGGAATVGTLGWMLLQAGTRGLVALVPLALAWVWVVWEVAATWAHVRRLEPAKAIQALRPRARRMPAWITATAWGALVAAACVPAGWGL
jgi:alpha-ketoglutarate-dependent taurine dioxygenase/4-hydroxybenzoate polyprenyltransferase